MPDAEHVQMIMAMVETGHADQVLISSDFAVAGSLKKNGGAGIAQAATVFGPMLLKAGPSEALLHQIMVDDPRRFLAFVPAWIRSDGRAGTWSVAAFLLA